MQDLRDVVADHVEIFKPSRVCSGLHLERKGKINFFLTLSIFAVSDSQTASVQSKIVGDDMGKSIIGGEGRLQS